MNKSEKAIVIKKILNQTYPKIPIPLDHKNTYQLLIAVLLSAQCTDVRVNEVTPKLFSLADTPIKMSKLKVNKIYKIVRPCGLAPQNLKQYQSSQKF